MKSLFVNFSSHRTVNQH